MAQNAADWRNLTAIQRVGWNDLGLSITRDDALGQAYTMNGFMAYCSVNNNRLAAGDTVLLDAPLYAPPDPLATLAPSITIATFSVAFTATPLAAATKLFISASPQRSAGRSFEGDFRLITVSAAAAASPLAIFSAYQLRFGTPVVGARIFTAAQAYFAGFLSAPLLASTVVA